MTHTSQHPAEANLFEGEKYIMEGGMGQKMTAAWHSQARVGAGKLKKRLNSFPSSS